MSSDSLEVTIGGQKLFLRGVDSADLREHVAQVNQTIAEITGPGGEVNVRVALLAALNLAETLAAERRKNLQLLQNIRARAVHISDCIERIPR
ncbi:cell division protein ZapA [Myxococcota bacterium]|nr:cell division protein ZapA [Myxococcota bacterium]